MYLLLISQYCALAPDSFLRTLSGMSAVLRM